MTKTEWLIIGGILLTIGTIVYRTGEWQGTLGYSIKIFRQKLQSLEKKVDKVYEWLAERGMQSTLGTSSPLDLNDLGKEIADTLQLETLADQYLENVKESLDEKKGAYEIQQHCLRYAAQELPVLLREQSPDRYQQMTEMAYQKGIPVEAVWGIVGVLMRKKLVPDG